MTTLKCPNCRQPMVDEHVRATAHATLDATWAAIHGVPLRIVGVGRDRGNDQGLVLYLNRAATNDEMIWLQECGDVIGLHMAQLAAEKDLMLGPKQ